MRKAVVATAGVAVVLVGGALGAAAWSGRAVSARLEEQTAELTRAFPSIKVLDQKVDHGLFQSTRSFTLQLGCAPTALQALPGAPAATSTGTPVPLQIQWRDVIHHAPFPSGHLGLASIDSELISPPAYKARIEQITDKKPLLSVHTAVDLSGGTVSDLTIPAMHYGDDTGSITSKPLTARVIASPGASARKGGTYSTVVPGLEFNVRATDGTSLAAKAGPITSETVIAPNDAMTWFAPSKVTGRLSALTLLGSAAKGMPIKPVQATFGAATFGSESKLEQGLFSTSSRFTGKALINDVSLDKFELAVSLKRLHAASYEKLMSTLLGSLFSCDPKAQQAALDGMFAEAQKELGNLLVHNPEYALEKLSVELAGKPAELSYSVGTQGITAADVTQPLPALLLAKGVLRVSAKVHAALTAQAVKQLGALDPSVGAAAGIPPSTGQGDQTLAFVNGMVDQFVGLGYLEREGDTIKASAAYEAGQVLVNGKPMALPDFGALGK